MDQPENELYQTGFDQLAEPVQQQWIMQLAEVNLPPLLMEMIQSRLELDTFNPKELANMASRDPVLGAKLLAVANSAKFGLTTPMTSIQRAVVHLGFNLVKTIMVAYQLEAVFLNLAVIPQDYLSFVRRWSCGASVIAFHWAQAADMPDSSTLATAALFGRLGTLLLGLAQPPPSSAYLELEDELARLRYESATWKATSPALGQLVAQTWGMPEPLPELIAGQPAPLVQELPAGGANRSQVLVSGALVLAESFLHSPDIPALQLMDLPAYAVLKTNLTNHKLLDDLHICWSSARMQRELASSTTD